MPCHTLTASSHCSPVSVREPHAGVFDLNHTYFQQQLHDHFGCRGICCPGCNGVTEAYKPRIGDALGRVIKRVYTLSGTPDILWVQQQRCTVCNNIFAHTDSSILSRLPQQILNQAPPRHPPLHLLCRPLPRHRRIPLLHKAARLRVRRACNATNQRPATFLAGRSGSKLRPWKFPLAPGRSGHVP